MPLKRFYENILRMFRCTSTKFLTMDPYTTGHSNGRTSSPSTRRRRQVVVGIVFALCMLLIYVGRSERDLSVYAPQVPATFTSQPKSESPSKFPKDFPKNIWQTGRENLRVKWADHQATWTSVNPDWKYEMLGKCVLSLLGPLVDKSR